MFGWRKRIGYITPTVIERVAYEFYRVAPEGVGLCGVSCNIEDWDPDEYDRGLSLAEKSADYLASRQVDFIIHGGGPLVFSQAQGYAQQLVQSLEKRTGIPSTTTIVAATTAMSALNAKRIAIASPYPEETNRALARYLNEAGFDVVRTASMPVHFKAIQSAPPEAIYRFAGDVLNETKEAEAIYMPCQQWPVGEVLHYIEADFGRPVVNSSTANFYAAFKTLKLRDKISGHGELLASLAAQ
jgi:maleate cis-trans isomerase